MSKYAIPGGIALALAGCGLSVVGVDANSVEPVEAGLPPVADAMLPPIEDSSVADVAPIDTGPPPCPGAPSAACCGTAACPQDTNECIDGKCYATLTASGKIDGRDELLLQGATMKWRHASYEEPTGIKVNGNPWPYNFPNNYDGDVCNACFSDEKALAPPMAMHEQAGILAAKTGRSLVEVLPATAANGFVLTLAFDDGPTDPSEYTATIKYETR